MSVARYLVTAALVTAAEPLNLEELVEGCRAGRQEVLGALFTLTDTGEVEEGDFVRGKPGPHYRLTVRKRVTAGADDAGDPDIEGAVAGNFHDFVINGYRPPADKRFLVFFQCAVRRPFSKAPSHASMRRAVAVATGFDPARESRSCPVHVVVMASRVGPVPYELEDLHPANVRSQGVQHFGAELYSRTRPILARRMAEYLTAHGAHYERVAAFTMARYAEVMRDAANLAGTEFPIFPERGGLAVESLGPSRPRSYWEKYWIQLALEIGRWIPDQGGEMRRRLSDLEVRFG